MRKALPRPEVRSATTASASRLTWVIATLLLASAAGCTSDQPKSSKEVPTPTSFTPRLESIPIGEALGENKAWITHLVIVDLDADGKRDVVACDSRTNQIRWIRQNPDGSYTEYIVGGEVRAPAHVSAADFDRDGDLDLLAASMGVLMPNNQKIGSVVLLRNDGRSAAASSPGATPVSGATGATSAAGANGRNGENGTVSANGTSGATGTVSANGTNGETGTASANGTSGETGTASANGTSGETGAAVASSSTAAGAMTGSPLAFTQHVLLQDVARVTDVEAADFDADGDMDLVVGQFGYDEGEIRWMENQGPSGDDASGVPQFESHRLLDLSGTINTPIGDLDGDGDPDIVAVVSQEWEEIHVFENKGAGQFLAKRVYGSTNEDFGSSGIQLTDLDMDGDLDVLYTNGDSFDFMPPGPRPWHGVQWLENTGGLEFAYHRIGDFPGAYSAHADDIDRDGDLDIFVVSEFNDWSKPNATSFGWFENTGGQQFTMRSIATTPTHLLVLDAADMDEDGDTDFVTGGVYFYAPYDRMARVLLWKNESAKTAG